MKTTGLFTTHRVEVQAKIGEPIKLIPFGDVHRDSDMHAHTHWQEFLKYAKAQTMAMEAKGDAQEAWLDAGGNPTQQHQFETAFRKAYDPRVFQFEVMDEKERAEIGRAHV
mgnify:CR=1 FL=1